LFCPCSAKYILKVKITCILLYANKHLTLNPLKTKRVCSIKVLSVCRVVNTPHHRCTKPNLLVVYKTKVIACSEIHIKQINAMWIPCRIFRRVRIIEKSDYWLRHVRPSVCLLSLDAFSWKFYILVFFESLSKKS